MASASDIFFGQPAQTGVQMMGGFRPPAADFARQFGQYLTGMIGQPLPTYPGQIDPGMSPSAQNLMSQAQSYSQSPMPAVWGGAMGSLGQFMNPAWNQPHQNFPQFFQPPGSPQTSRGPFQMPGQGVMPGGPSMGQGGGGLPQAPPPSPGIPQVAMPQGFGGGGGGVPAMGGAPQMGGGMPMAMGMSGGGGGPFGPQPGPGGQLSGMPRPGLQMTPGGSAPRFPGFGMGQPGGGMQSMPMPSVGFGDKGGGMGGGGIGPQLPGVDQRQGPRSGFGSMTPGFQGGGQLQGRPSLPQFGSMTPGGMGGQFGGGKTDFGSMTPGGAGVGGMQGKPGQWNMTPGGPGATQTRPLPMQYGGANPTDPASGGGYGALRPGAGGGQEIFLGQGWMPYNQSDPNQAIWARRNQQYGPDAWRAAGQGGGHWGDAGGAFQAINGRQASTQELDDLFFRGGQADLMRQSAGLPVEQWLRNVGGIAAGPGGRAIRPGYFAQR